MANIEPLRPFQAEDVPYFLSHPKSMILYEPRLGKTVVTCNVVALDPETRGSVLIACSKNALSVWIDHIQSWFAYLRPDIRLDFRLIRGGVLERKALWTAPRDPNALTIHLITFHSLLTDEDILVKNKLRFDTVIGDEVHTRLRNRKTKSSEQFRRLAKESRRYHALSGTLTGKWGPADYWNIINMINPYEFGSYWKFVGTYCLLEDGYFGKEIVGVRNEEAFHRTLARYGRIRKRADVAPQMPKVQRDLLYVDMAPDQAKLYEQIGRESIAFTEGGNVVVSRNSLERMTRKRQLLTCPKILDKTLGVGAAFENILENLAEARENEDTAGQHIVIFTAVRKAIEHWEAALRNAGYTNVFTLVGGTEPEDVVRITNAFEQTRGIMICMTQFAQAFSLASSTLCYHIGWDYDPNNNRQAEDRLVAQVGDWTINSYYYAYKATDDDLLAYRITMKNKLIYATTTNPKLLQASDPLERVLFDEKENLL